MAGRSNPRSPRIVLGYLRGRYPGVTAQQLRYCLRHGFYPERALEYDFATYRPQDYFPDSTAGSPGRTIEPGEIECCRDKLFFALLMGAIGASTPPVLAENVGGRLIFYTDKAGDFETLLGKYGELVVKPRGNVGGGEGVRIVRPGDADPAPRPGELVTPRIQQHAYAATIYPGTANTIRVLTAWDYDRGDHFIAAAGHRFGSSLATCVDNWGAGGVSCGVDVATGRLGPAVRNPKFDAQRTPRATHPDTGAQIDGVVIPRFQEMCEGLLRVARRFPRRYVGWDIVITPDSWTLIEANHIPMLSALQLHRPLLLDPRLRTFYKREGVL